MTPCRPYRPHYRAMSSTALAELVDAHPPLVRVVLRIIQYEYDVTAVELVQHGQRSRYGAARMMAGALLVEVGFSKSEAGRLLCRDQSTIDSGIRRVALLQPEVLARLRPLAQAAAFVDAWPPTPVNLQQTAPLVHAGLRYWVERRMPRRLRESVLAYVADQLLHIGSYPRLLGVHGMIALGQSPAWRAEVCAWLAEMNLEGYSNLMLTQMRNSHCLAAA